MRVQRLFLFLNHFLKPGTELIGKLIKRFPLLHLNAGVGAFKDVLAFSGEIFHALLAFGAQPVAGAILAGIFLFNPAAGAEFAQSAGNLGLVGSGDLDQPFRVQAFFAGIQGDQHIEIGAAKPFLLHVQQANPVHLLFQSAYRIKN
nr:hypothetical protein [Allobaculum sp. Allo2]